MPNLSAAQTPIASHPQPAMAAGFAEEGDALARELSDEELVNAWKQGVAAERLAKLFAPESEAAIDARAAAAKTFERYEAMAQRHDDAQDNPSNDSPLEPPLVMASLKRPFDADAILSLLDAKQSPAERATVANERDSKGLPAVASAATNPTLNLSDAKSNRAFRAIVAESDTTRPIPYAGEPQTVVDWAARGDANPAVLEILARDLASRDVKLLRASVGRALRREAGDDFGEQPSTAPTPRGIRAIDAMASALDPRHPESETLQSAVLERFPGQLPKTLAVNEQHVLSSALASPEGQLALAEARAKTDAPTQARAGAAESRAQSNATASVAGPKPLVAAPRMPARRRL